MNNSSSSSSSLLHQTKPSQATPSSAIMIRFLVCGLVLFGSTTNAWIQQRPAAGIARGHATTRTTTPLRMVNFLNGGGTNNKGLPTLPRDVKDAFKQCRAAVQEALGGRLSRMDVEFPVGTKFGVEKTPTKSKSKQRNQSSMQVDNSDGAPTQDTLDQSDRELARLFVEMFQPVGGGNICAIFNDVALADTAKKNWKDDPSAESRILSLDRRKSAVGALKKKKKAVQGFAAKLAAEVGDSADNESQSQSGPFQLPEGTEVALFVAPGPKELVIIERICKSAGMGTLVVLLNARLSSISNFGSDAATKLFREDFEPVFNLSAGPQESAPGCLLYRAYPGDWVLARKPRVGQPKTILSQGERPLEEECKAAFDVLELTDVERGMESVLENVAGWFR
jgi:hypothetical protein